jgi:ferrous iron transport protein B
MPTLSRKTIALVGNPNAGKSSLFNELTGLRQQVSNFPGVTVEKKIGVSKLSDGQKIDIIDLPGCYSLFPNSTDEKIVIDTLLSKEEDDKVDLVVYVLDINNLERHLLLASQVYDLGKPMILVVNMIDLYEEKGMVLDIAPIKALLPVDIIKVSTKTGLNVDQISDLILKNLERPIRGEKQIYDLSDNEKIIALEIKELDSTKSIYESKVLAHHYSWVQALSPAERINIGAIVEKREFHNIKTQISETMRRFQIIQEVVMKTIKSSKKTGQRTITDKIDSIVTHNIGGPIIFFSLMFLIFQSIYAWSEKPMEWIEEAFVAVGNFVKYGLGQGWMADLISDGLLAGLSGVMVFIPQITILFLLIAILEESGYMSRAVYLFDGILKRFGMNGRSIVALVSSGACAVPAIMSTRTIGSYKERLITIMVAPLVSCSARLPVYALLVGFVVPNESIWGVFNLQGLLFMALYLMGIIMVFIVSFILNKWVKPDSRSHLMIEMPQYKQPIFKNILLSVKEKVWAFITSAGKVIMIISIILWFLSSFGPSESMKAAEEKAISMAQTQNLSPEEKDNLIAGYKLESSFAGILGKTIEPLIKPLGFDWKIGIALITSFAAREVFVGTMATIYSIGSTDDEATIRQRMAAEVRSDGSKLYDPATSFSLLIFYVFAMQCMSTLAATRKETNSWKWTLVQLGYLSLLAYFGSLIFYSIFG